MPARKPAALHTRHDTNDTKAARAAAESSMQPRTQLSKTPPPSLKGHKVACATWQRLYALYAETQGTLVTAFDSDLLVKYCQAEEETFEIESLRAEVKILYVAHSKLLAHFKPNAKNIGIYLGALQQANLLLTRFKDFDARLDAKRKFLHDLAKSLYLTPRSRAGVAPKAKEAEAPKDAMEQVLSE